MTERVICDVPVGVTSPDPLNSSVGPPVRLRLSIAYDGTEFSGWAAQPERRTVQQTLEYALRTALRLPQVRLTVAGRTDAGVHATGQVAHLDVPAAVWDTARPTLVRRLAGLLPADIRVSAVQHAPDSFDARFGALWRRYSYRLTDAEHGVDPLRRHDTVAWSRRLDADAMAQAAAGLLGEHDFAAYCRARTGATTVRGLQELGVHRDGTLVVVTAQADAFCHSMVRSLVGALLAVGEGRKPLNWPAGLLALRERCGAVPVAPAGGLTLVEVGYPPDDQLALRAQLTRRVRV